jgi:YHS domain-containing protein
VSPIKLVILAGLLYFGYRLLISDWNKKKNDQEEDTEAKSVQGEQVEDVLVEDPVCHKLVPKQQAIRLKQRGTEGYKYFCSEECRNTFVSQTGDQE